MPELKPLHHFTASYFLKLLITLCHWSTGTPPLHPPPRAPRCMPLALSVLFWKLSLTCCAIVRNPAPFDDTLAKALHPYVSRYTPSLPRAVVAQLTILFCHNYRLISAIDDYSSPRLPKNVTGTTKITKSQNSRHLLEGNSCPSAKQHGTC